ncbi:MULTISPECIES: hypothetical protein [Limnospira]|nr:hypothetical protein [Limnospira maxima]EDZ94315.1 response regulator receiver signal transduction histidine kinase [Limnospira maxima CS-328]MDC0836725.1 hypothetical protein [Limnoraphis robusta]
MNLYRQEYPHPSPRILDLAEKLELDFVLEDLRNLIRSMKTGIKRIYQIMLAWRIFCRTTNEADMKSIDWH